MPVTKKLPVQLIDYFKEKSSIPEKTSFNKIEQDENGIMLEEILNKDRKIRGLEKQVYNEIQ